MLRFPSFTEEEAEVGRPKQLAGVRKLTTPFPESSLAILTLSCATDSRIKPFLLLGGEGPFSQQFLSGKDEHKDKLFLHFLESLGRFLLS